MKKIFSIILMTLVIVGCSTNDNDDASNDSSDGSEISTIEWMAGPQGGVTYPFGVAMSDVISDIDGDISTHIVEGGSISNLQNVNDNDAQMGHTMSDVVFAGAKGEEPFKEKTSDVRVIGKAMDFQYQFSVVEELGVSSFEELKENQIPIRIITNERGSAAEAMTSEVLKAHGISYEDIESWGGNIQFLPFDEAVQQVQNKNADALSMQSAVPTPFFEEILFSQDLVFFSIKDDIISSLSDEFGYVEGNIPKGTYKGVDEDVKTVQASMTLLVHKDIPDEFVYEFTKKLFEEETIENLEAISKNYENISPEYSLDNLIGTLHPGAEKFYKEEGFLE